MNLRSNLAHCMVVKRKPLPRPGVYELYWKFAALRQAAFERRVAGGLAPWSDDPILQRYKFCNVYRAADRVSQYMIRSVACSEQADTVADRLFQIVAFRVFSQIQVWNGLSNILKAKPSLAALKSGEFERALDILKKERGGLYTGAFILCATKAFGFDEKHRNHVALFKHMFFDRNAAERLMESSSLEQVVRLLEEFPLTGPFMSYQTAVDLNYSDLLNFSENDYTQAGPGAIRGIRKAFTDLADYTHRDVIDFMVERQEAEFERLGLQFSGLFGRPLHAIDCQGLFCELDKYCREAVPELRSARSRIKTTFTPSEEPLALFFPPKWKINRQLPVITRTGSQFALFGDA